MPVPQSLYAYLGAAVLGAIGIAGVVIVRTIKEKNSKQRYSQDVARIQLELNEVKRQLQYILAEREKPKHRKSKSAVRKVNSTLSTASDEYLSTGNLDSSDLEFYDVSDYEDQYDGEDLEKAIVEIDRRLECGNLTELEQILDKLQELCIENPENCELLYRIGKTHNKIVECVNDSDSKQNHIAKGIDACSQALKINPQSAESHKWYAILVGARSEFQSMQDRISDGHLFKKHVDSALEINPSDPVLHHMLGRFSLEVAKLKWYERKVAAAIFGEPPAATYSDALECFLAAENLKVWKENRLLIAKCKIEMSEFKEAFDWLTKAAECECDELDDKVDSEVKVLLEEYSSYR